MKAIYFLLLFATFASAQNQYPKDYFRPPLDIPMQLSGNFGELRPNHFHAGFDFKTNQREGLNVYAVGDGYVSRIKNSTFGYGKAIYINHPNGYTSVYGHLQKAASSRNGSISQLVMVQKVCMVALITYNVMINIKLRCIQMGKLFLTEEISSERANFIWHQILM